MMKITLKYTIYPFGMAVDVIDVIAEFVPFFRLQEADRPADEASQGTAELC